MIAGMNQGLPRYRGTAAGGRKSKALRACPVRPNSLTAACIPTQGAQIPPEPQKPLA